MFRSIALVFQLLQRKETGGDPPRGKLVVALGPGLAAQMVVATYP